jgi:hypothetical protein
VLPSRGGRVGSLQAGRRDRLPRCVRRKVRSHGFWLPRAIPEDFPDFLAAEMAKPEKEAEQQMTSASAPAPTSATTPTFGSVNDRRWTTSAARSDSSAKHTAGRSSQSTSTKSQARNPTGLNFSTCGGAPPNAGSTFCFFGRSTASHERAFLKPSTTFNA